MKVRLVAFVEVAAVAASTEMPGSVMAFSLAVLTAARRSASTPSVPSSSVLNSALAKKVFSAAVRVSHTALVIDVLVVLVIDVSVVVV